MSHSSTLLGASVLCILGHILLSIKGEVAAVTSDIFNDGEFNALREMLIGPVRNKTIFIHIDENVPRDIRETVIAIPELQQSSHFLTIFGNSSAKCPKQVPPLNTNTLHIVIFFSAHQGVFTDLYQCWTPRSLLLYGVEPQDPSTIFNYKVLDKIKELVVILRNTTVGLRGVFTRLPFENKLFVFQGKWNLSSFSTWNALFIDRFPNFKGCNFQLASWAVIPPCVYTDKTTSSNEIIGSSVRMLNAIGMHLNFSFVGTLEPPDRKWGVRINNSWVGMLGQVHSTLFL